MFGELDSYCSYACDSACKQLPCEPSWGRSTYIWRIQLLYGTDLAATELDGDNGIVRIKGVIDTADAHEYDYVNEIHDQYNE